MQKLDKEGFLIKCDGDLYYVQSGENRLEWQVDYHQVPHITVRCGNFIPLQFSSVQTALRVFNRAIGREVKE